MNEAALKDAPDRRSGFPSGAPEASREGEAAQSRSDIPYRALFDAIDQGFSVVDLIFDDVGRPVDYVFVEVNPAFEAQTGLHDATGRVYRFSAGRLDCLMSNIPSPNGIALDASGRFLFTAVTRANQVWRGPLLADGSISKVGAFRTFFGASGPDGMAVDRDNRLVVAHASLGGAFVLNARGEVTHFVKSPVGQTVTNVAYRPGTPKLVMTESETGTILEADLPGQGAPLFSHAGG